MKRTILSIFLLFAVGGLGFSQTQWSLDKSHSTVGFEVEHIIVVQKVIDTPEDYYTMGRTDGKFMKFDLKFTPGNEDFSNSKVEATIAVNSVDTDNPARDGHLVSEDFFDAAKYPNIQFVSKSFTKTGDKTYTLAGDITIKGVTQPITFDVVCTSEFAKMSESQYFSFTATGLLDRYDFGLKWTELIEQGGFRVSSNVQLKIQANLIKSGKSYANEKHN